MTNLKLGSSRVGQVCIYPQPLTQPVRMQREQPLIERVIDQSGGMGLTFKYVRFAGGDNGR